MVEDAWHLVYLGSLTYSSKLATGTGSPVEDRWDLYSLQRRYHPGGEGTALAYVLVKRKSLLSTSYQCSEP